MSVSKELLELLGVSALLLVDSSSTSLTAGAHEDFPAPRSNVIPAAIKLHLCMDLLSGATKWFTLSKGTSHDSNHFPPLKLLKGALIIFDLGYWDFERLRSIAAAGAFFLSRIKENTRIEIKKIVSGLPKGKFEGSGLFDMRLPKKKGKKIIEIIGIFGAETASPFEARVIGFWNKSEKHYHWYVTNLLVPAAVIYPLYRLRWQIELVFKACKSSFGMDTIKSSCKNIIINLQIFSLVAHMITHPMMKSLIGNTMKKKEQCAATIQRGAIILLQMSKELRDFLLGNDGTHFEALRRKMELFADELIDPNYKKRPTGLQRLRDALHEATKK